MNSAILAVGTEITDGQIINSNASWLSERLKPLGPRCVLHLTVPDDRDAIRRALDLCAEHASLIFVTGGLGPTSDDFTREIVSEWAETKLDYHAPSWSAIQERLSARNYPVREIQKQQAYFPRGSVVLPNSQGTANGFRLRARDRDLVVLPGPPRELAAIWTDHVASWIRHELAAGLDPVVTKSWDTIGRGESQIAELMIPLVRDTSLEVGYRVHLPYVEFKVSYPRSQAERHAAVLTAIDDALAPLTIARDGDDVAAIFARRLGDAKSVTIIDQVSGHSLLRRLQEPMKTFFAERDWTLTTEDLTTSDLTFWLKPVDEHEARIGVRQRGQVFETFCQAPMTATTMAERRKQYFAEIALAQWGRWL